MVLFLVLNLFYNQKRGTLIKAGELELRLEELEMERLDLDLDCGREIPVGEAMEKTAELMKAINEELDKIDRNLFEAVVAVNEMTDLAKECDTNKCKPVDCESYEVLGTTYCRSKACVPANPCPIDKIAYKQTVIEKAYDEIAKSERKIRELIESPTELLCLKEEKTIDGVKVVVTPNIDIITKDEEKKCEKNLCWEKPNFYLCPKISKLEVTKRKLNLSRGKFYECYVPREEIEERKEPKYLLNCQTVIGEGYPRQTKTTRDGFFDCTSPHNWFCCQ